MNSEDESGMKLKTYLYVTSYNEDKSKLEAILALTKAVLYVEVAIELENFGEFGILFTSYHEVDDINSRIKKHGIHYLLLDITLNVSMQTVVGMLPNADLEQVKTLQMRAGQGVSKEDRIKHLKFYREEAVREQKYELAAELRDKIKKLEQK
jgi:hypothetical protein